MKKLLLMLVIFLTSCCSTTRNFNNNQTYQLLDSILKAERVLTYDSIPLKDYETGEKFYVYYFIRDSLVLRWIERGDSVQITKRINK